MLNKMVGYTVLAMSLVVVLGGCSAHMATPKTATAPVAVDWRAALTEKGECTAKPDISQSALIECLMRVSEIHRQNAEMLSKQLAARNAANQSVPAPGPNTGLVPEQKREQHASLTYQQFLSIPAAAGPICDSPKELTLTVTNQTPYLIEVSGGGKLAPYNCDAQSNLAYFNVVKADGTAERILAVPPAIDGRSATARFVFLPLNGGMGDMYKGSGPEVDFVRYEFQHSNDPMHPIASPYAGLPMIAKRFSVPRTDGNWIVIE